MSFLTFRRFISVNFLAFLVGATIAVTAAHGADQEALEKRFQEANAKVDAGDFKAALEMYNGILEEEPEAGNVWVMRGVAKWNLKDRSGARADLAQAIKLHPDNVDAYRVRGQFRYQAEDWDGSLADFNKAIELVAPYEPQAELFGMRAEVQSKRGETLAAIRDLDEAIKLNPDYVAAIYLRGQMYETESNLAAAEADYTKVVGLDPQHADAFNNRAWIRFHAEKWDAAIADARATLKIAPKAAIAMRAMGYSQFGRGDYAEAAKTLGEAYDADPVPDSAFALYIRHYALLRSGGADKRLATSWGAWKDQPWLQALAKFITGSLDEEQLEAAAKDTADDEELLGRACEMHFYMGLTRLQAGDRSTARLRFESALKTDRTTFIEYTLAKAELARLKKK